MSYWCYFTDTMTEDTAQRIKDECVMTFPNKPNIVPGDKIILYSKGKFTGYMESISRIKSNLLENGNPKIPIFMDNKYNIQKMKVNLFRIKVKGFRKSDVFDGNDPFLISFDKNLNKKEPVIMIGIDMGVFIFKYFQNHPDIVKKEKVKEKVDQVIIEEFNKKSNFIIPIVIIPCHDIKLLLKKETVGNDRIDLLIKHVIDCRICSVTNNNARVPIETLVGKIKRYYRMANPIEVGTLLDYYYAMRYYSTKKTTLAKICDSLNEYYGCYFIIATLDKER